MRSYPFRTLNLESEAAGNRLRQILADIPSFTGMMVLNTGNVTGMWCPSPSQALHGKPVTEALLAAFGFGVPWSACKFLFHLPNVRTMLNFKCVENRWVVAIADAADDETKQAGRGTVFFPYEDVRKLLDQPDSQES